MLYECVFQVRISECVGSIRYDCVCMLMNVCMYMCMCTLLPADEGDPRKTVPAGLAIHIKETLLTFSWL